MLKKISRLIVLLGMVGFISCSSTIPSEKYIEVMSTLGCKLVMEGTPEAEALYKELNVTQEDIMTFRKKTDAKKMMQVSATIAKKVAECHQVQLQPLSETDS